MSHKNLAAFRWLLVALITLAACCVTLAQQSKSAPAKTSLTGHYEGSAKNSAQDDITVALDLTDKDGALSGMIRSSHGDFTITGGSRDGDAVKLEFDANGTTGTISLHLTEDKLVGSWSAGDDGGPLDVKRVAAQPDAQKPDDQKGKS